LDGLQVFSSYVALLPFVVLIFCITRGESYRVFKLPYNRATRATSATRATGAKERTVAVVDLWVPYPPGIWTAPGAYGSSFFTNPFSTEANPACDVWIQLTAGMAFPTDSSWYIGYGIFEIEFIGSSGVETTTYADINDIANANFADVPVITYQPNLLSFTVGWAAPKYYGCVYPTLIQWG
jgi:hypothetical protein